MCSFSPAGNIETPRQRKPGGSNEISPPSPHMQVPTKTLAKPQDCRGSGNTTALDGTPLPNVVQYIKDGKVDLVINIPEVRGEELPFLFYFCFPFCFSTVNST